ncbi:PAS domain S-box protein [Achromobacter sp. GG226]|nr:PAS domain S-box protein [Verticiella sp. GG226]
MSSFPILQDEASRLAALSEYGVRTPLDDPGFDRLVQLAARTFQVPIALVSLVESERQLFAAGVGLSVCETARESSFCAHALGSHDLLIVPDARRDPRFADNALVLGYPFIRFYAGCPLVSPLGYVVGTLCIIDTQARPRPTEAQCADLRDLAGFVMDKLELRRLELARQASRRRFETLAQAVSDAVICTDGAGRVTSWNDAAHALLGVAAGEARGQLLESLLPGTLMPGLRRLSAEESADHARVSMRLETTPEGALSPVSLHVDAALWRENGRTSYCVVLRDASTGWPARNVLTGESASMAGIVAASARGSANG